RNRARRCGWIGHRGQHARHRDRLDGVRNLRKLLRDLVRAHDALLGFPVPLGLRSASAVGVVVDGVALVGCASGDGATVGAVAVFAAFLANGFSRKNATSASTGWLAMNSCNDFSLPGGMC